MHPQIRFQLGAKRTFIVCFASWLFFAHFSFAATYGDAKIAPLSRQEISKLGSVTPEGLIFSGDIIFYVDTLIRSGIVANKWPGGKLFFETDASVSSAQKNAFLQACQAWASGTPVTCIERSVQPNYVRLATHNGERCSGANTSCSALGMRGGVQDLFVYSGHWGSPYVLQHELGHAFGMIHEQQRNDRDSYVTILWANIKPGTESNFRMVDVATATEYDFESIMHYNNCAFSSQSGCSPSVPVEGLSSIFPKACNRDLVGGNSITSLDVEGMRAAYLPQIFGLYKRSRRGSCGVHDLSPEQIKLMCGAGSCSRVGAIIYNKREDFHEEQCGSFATDPPNYKRCPPMKTLIGASHNSSTFACGFANTSTKFYWDWTCACGKQALEKLCSEVEAEFDANFVEKLRQSSDPRDTATVRYLDQVSGWRKRGFVEERTAKVFGYLLIKNYLQDGFNERLFAVLCKMRIVIELHLYVKTHYTLRHSDFLKFAEVEGVAM